MLLNFFELIAFTVFIFYVTLDFKLLSSFVWFQKNIRLDELSI